MAKPLVNSGDPDQTPHSAASDLGLYCLPVILLQKGLIHAEVRYKSFHFDLVQEVETN